MKDTNYNLKLSLNEVEVAHSKHALVLEEKAAFTVSEYLNEAARHRCSDEDVIWQVDGRNCPFSDDSHSKPNSSGNFLIPVSLLKSKLPELC